MSVSTASVHLVLTGVYEGEVCRHLPSGVVVAEVDKVLHKPGVDLTESEALVRGLQNGLGTRGMGNR